MIYDLFYVSFGKIEDDDWDKFHSRFPISQKIENIKSIDEIKSKSFTKLFWVVWDDIEVLDDTVFDYVVPKWDEEYVHVFKNGEFFDGINIFSKSATVTNKEFRYRFFFNKKEIDKSVSCSKPYDTFVIDTYDDYLKAMETSKTEMFWMTSNNLKISKNFNFRFTYHNSEDRLSNHSFIHRMPLDWITGPYTENKNRDLYYGVHLLSKKKPVSKKEIEHRFLIEKREWPIVASGPVKYDIFNIETYDDYLKAMETSKTEMFWMTSPNIDTDNFEFNVYFSHNQQYERSVNHAFIHRVNGKDYYNGVFLISKQQLISKREIEYRHLTQKKEWPIVASGPVKYDIFDIETYDDYLKAMETSKTEMFWMTSPNLNTDNFDFDLYFTHNENLFERTINHSFIHQVDGKNLRNGVHLLSKKKLVSKKEIEHRFLIEKKEWPIVASGPVKYDIFDIETYDDYLKAMETSKTEMFWMTSPNLNTDNFDFNVYFSHNQQYERNENHAFIHRVNGKDYYNGVFLISKQKSISKREIEHRHLTQKKEWPIVASGPIKYDIFDIETYDDYLTAMETSKTEMFWMTSPNIDTSNFNFDLYFTHNQQYERNENHTFIHRVNGKNLRNGVHLLSKKKPVSKKEIEHRFLIEKKEWPIVASGPVKYDKFVVNTYDDYLNAVEESKTEMFWIIPKEVEMLDDIELNLYFSHDSMFDRRSNHVFGHLFRGEVTYTGISLVPKFRKLTKKEIDFRHIIERKNHDTVFTRLKPYDIVFISYNEPNADENYQELLSRFPRAKRVHGVKGIHNAHKEAAMIAETDMFWVVDGDAKIDAEFNFEYEVSRYELDIVHVWKSKNPINDLVYGYGGVKLLPTELTENLDVTSPDMTTSISSRFKAMPSVSNITAFDTDEFNTWKSAFRECVKLSSKIINRQEDIETAERLNIWCNSAADTKYGKYAIAGANSGRIYGEENKNNIEALSKINDFDWLKKVFDEQQSK
jgi:CYTH domain-containing protein